ncbi:MAG: folylpolyglutamate synthase/dihydrofolate synthase family protein [Acidobacteriota bacterium]
MNFGETETYLLSLGNEVSAMKLGLENIRKLLAALGDPQKKYLKVQVAGTNGKGSACAFLNSICLQAGIKTGMYTSPHLVSITERIQIEGTNISNDDFARIATRVREVAECLVADGEIENVPTFFEQVTAIALLAFADAKVGLAILETGLGGRLDATTAANAEIAAITRIDYDHQQYLGETIQEIAAEKAAIIRHGLRVVLGEQKPEVMEVIRERCRKVGVQPRVADEAIATQSRNPIGMEGVAPGIAETPSIPVGLLPVRFTTSKADYSEIRLGLLGHHQIENAKVAILLAEFLQDNFRITSDHIVSGLETARHPGRMEWIAPYLLDGAHNVGGARALRAYLDEFVQKPVTMIYGSIDDKDVKEIASVLFPRAERLILTTPDNSRAMRAEDILLFVPEGFDQGRVFVTPSANAAIEKAREVSGKQDAILVTGSLYLVGEVHRILTAKPSEKLKTDN